MDRPPPAYDGLTREGEITRLASPPPRYSEDSLPDYSATQCPGCKELGIWQALLGLGRGREHVLWCERWVALEGEGAEGAEGRLLPDDADRVMLPDSDDDETDSGDELDKNSGSSGRKHRRGQRRPRTHPLLRSLIVTVLLLLLASSLSLSLASSSQRRHRTDRTRDASVQVLMARIRASTSVSESADLAELLRLRTGLSRHSNPLFSSADETEPVVYLHTTFRARLSTGSRVSVVRILGRPAVLSSAFFRSSESNPHPGCVHGRPPRGYRAWKEIVRPEGGETEPELARPEPEMRTRSRMAAAEWARNNERRLKEAQRTDDGQGRKRVALVRVEGKRILVPVLRRF